MSGIKESLEIVELLKTVAEAISAAKDDGHINWFDVPKFAPVIVSARRAVENSHLIDDEIKDLSAEESQVLAKAALVAGTLLMEAVLKK